MISDLKFLRFLTLDTTDVTDDGLENLICCPSLQWLELVKYKGPDANTTNIDSQTVLKWFAMLAALRPDQWFDLRLDIDVFELNDEVKRQVPRNVRIVNVGHKK